MKQLTDDFESRFRRGDTPWEEAEPWRGLGDVLERFVGAGASVLDVGCGLGTNALHLAALGYRVLGIDVSTTAIQRADKRRRQSTLGAECRFQVADFLKADCGQHDVVFDRGCLHGFADAEGRSRFAQRAAAALVPGGLWIDISGSRDNGDPPDAIRDLGLPRLTLQDLASAAEPHFEAIQIRRGTFGETPDTDFLAWVSVFCLRAGRG